MNEQTDPRKGGTSASSAQADLLCEGRHLAQKGLPDIKSDAADFGNAIHAALASGDPSKLTEDQRNIFDSCQEIESALVQQVFSHEAAKAKSFREQRLWVQVLSADGSTRYLHSAQPDVVYRFGPTALVVEYKSLAGDQAASPSNLQLRDQAVLASRFLVAQEVFTAIIQPLVTHAPELCRYDEPSLKQAESEMFERVRRSNNPSARRTPGDVQCQWCRAKSSCQAYLDWSASALPIPTAESPFFIAMQLWTPEQRSFVAERLPVLRKVLADSEAFLKDCLRKDPEGVPGFHLAPGAVRKEITDPESLFARFIELGGSLEQFMKCVSITKKELESALRSVSGKKGKALAAEMDKLVEGIIEEKQNQPSLSKKG